jgi:hypothetical protein
MIRAALSLLLLLAAAAHAQQIGQNAPAGGNNPATFSTSSQLVIETVNVKDKSGKPVEGLDRERLHRDRRRGRAKHSFLRISESA